MAHRRLELLGENQRAFAQTWQTAGDERHTRRRQFRFYIKCGVERIDRDPRYVRDRTGIEFAHNAHQAHSRFPFAARDGEAVVEVQQCVVCGSEAQVGPEVVALRIDSLSRRQSSQRVKPNSMKKMSTEYAAA